MKVGWRDSYQKCRECPELFLPRRRGGTPQVYCSDRCKSRNDNRARLERHPDRVRDWWIRHPGYGTERQEATKRIVMAAYGGTVCACCGERRLAFLTIDHIARDGAQHRRWLRDAKTSLYRWLRENNFPSGYRVFCMNCNFATRHGKPCPHESERTASA